MPEESGSPAQPITPVVQFEKSLERPLVLIQAEEQVKREEEVVSPEREQDLEKGVPVLQEVFPTEQTPQANKTNPVKSTAHILKAFHRVVKTAVIPVLGWEAEAVVPLLVAQLPTLEQEACRVVPLAHQGEGTLPLALDSAHSPGVVDTRESLEPVSVMMEQVRN